MIDQEPRSIPLSAEGELRRARIGAALIARSRARRRGRGVLAGAACLMLLAGAGLLARSFVNSAPAPRPIAVGPTPADPTPTEPMAPAPPFLGVRIAVFTNEPIPDRPCASASGAGSSSSQVPVCILNDQQLLSALSATGESYGLIRVGGRTLVVSNSTH